MNQAKNFLSKIIEEKSNKMSSYLTNLTSNDYGLSVRTIADYLNGHLDLECASIYEIWVLFSIIAPKQLEEYFLEKQIANCEKERQNRILNRKLDDKSIFEFKAIQDYEDQFHAIVPIRQLLKLRDGGYINYNEETQRPLKKIQTENGVEYQIFVNSRRINGIVKSIIDNIYIPGAGEPIVLNVNNSEFTYDDENNILSFDEFECDIIDGFHRLIAFNKACIINPDLDMNVIVSFVLFSKEKAEQLIWQSDQKTHMNKSMVSALKQNDVANQIVSKLSTDPSSLLCGKVGKTRQLIEFGLLSTELRKNFGLYKTYSRKQLNEKFAEIKNKLNALLENHEDLLCRMWDVADYKIIINIIRNFQVEQYEEAYSYLYNEIKKIDKANSIKISRVINDYITRKCGE